MAYVLIDAVRSGTLYVNGAIFVPGVNEIPETLTLEECEKACEDLRWANVVTEGPAPDPDADHPAPAEDAPPEPALPVSAEETVAAAVEDPHVADRASRLKSLVEGERVEKTDPSAFPCPQCDKVLKSAFGRERHVQLKHAE